MTEKRSIKNIILKIRFIKTCLSEGIKDDDILWLFIKQAFGVSVPRKAVCKEHQAPFTFLADLFFERVDNCLILGNRLGGKTFLIVGILNALNMVFKPGITITSSASVQSQAQQGYKHFKKLTKKKWWLDPDILESIQTRTIFRNNSELEIIVSSMDGFNSKHPNILIVDEVDLIKDWDILEEAFSMSAGTGGFLPQNIFLSTRKSSTGTMQKLINECRDRGFKLYSFCVWEIAEKCREKVQCQECSIYRKCEGIARESRGFLPIKDVKRKAKNMDLITWKSQWECKIPPSSGSFYSDFSRNSHVIDVKSFRDKYKLPCGQDMKAENLIPKDWIRFSGIDFGYSHPTCFLAFAYSPLDDIIYCYKEFYETNLIDSKIVNAWQGMTKHPETGKMYFQKANFIWNSEPWLFIVADSASPGTIQALNEVRAWIVPVTRSNSKLEKNKEYSYAKVRERLAVRENGLPGLIFFNTCYNAIREHEALCYPANKKEKSEFPASSQDDHSVDVVRYAITRFYRVLKAKKADEVHRGSLKATGFI